MWTEVVYSLWLKSRFRIMVLNPRNHLNKGHLAPTCQQNDKFSPSGLIWQVNIKWSFVIRHKVLELYLYPWALIQYPVEFTNTASLLGVGTLNKLNIIIIEWQWALEISGICFPLLLCRFPWTKVSLLQSSMVAINKKSFCCSCQVKTFRNKMSWKMSD